MNDISKLPGWVQEKIAELERELRSWQDLYVELVRLRPNRRQRSSCRG